MSSEFRVRSDSIIGEKSFNFAVRIINLHKYLCKKYDRTLAKQLLRSGTSIGANTQEAISAQSTSDFVSKLSIALKEARETYYWLRLLKATNYLTETESQTILNECNEIISILVSIIKTTKSNNDAK